MQFFLSVQNLRLLQITQLRKLLPLWANIAYFLYRKRTFHYSCVSYGKDSAIYLPVLATFLAHGFHWKVGQDYTNMDGSVENLRSFMEAKSHTTTEGVVQMLW